MIKIFTGLFLFPSNYIVIKITEVFSMAKEKDPKSIEDYNHEQKLRNNPSAGDSVYDVDANPAIYYLDEWADPTLLWNRKKAEPMKIPTTSIYRRELIQPKKIIDQVLIKKQCLQPTLFETDEEIAERRKQELEFYQHDRDWANRMIAGDSLLVMNSMLEREAMSGAVQMIYFDPPYGIRYGSNFQPFVNKRDVKDRDEDLSTEPETIKAFRDTWQRGIHSYLDYIRERLILCRALLRDSGSIFVQIGDENVHRVRCVLDEVFGPENCVSQIFVQKASGRASGYLDGIGDYLLWYCNDKSQLKYRQLFLEKSLQYEKNVYKFVEFPDGTRRSLTKEEISNPSLLGKNARIFPYSDLTQQGSSGTGFSVKFSDKLYKTSENHHWITHEEGMKRLIELNRVAALAKTIRYIRYFDDFPLTPIRNNWNDTGGESNKIYVVQTSRKVIQRCMLMSTDPGDLVLDITCGSGTTAYVAEQFGRRWITCDTSRIAIELAKERISTAVFDYYQLHDEKLGLTGNFEYKTVPHITLKSIANNLEPDQEILYDQPLVDKTKARVSGPFTIESLPQPIIFSIDDAVNNPVKAWLNSMRQQLSTTGILGKNGVRIPIARCYELNGWNFFNATAETDKVKKCLIYFGNDSKSIDARIVSKCFEEYRARDYPADFLIFAGFQFDAEAEEIINSEHIDGVQILEVLMNPDLAVGDLKKNVKTDQSFLLVGQPEIELTKNSDGTYVVKLLGADYFDVNAGKVISKSTKEIAMWLLDDNYERGKVFEPSQMFFPMSDSSRGWNLISKTLRREIDPEKLKAYSGNESIPFKPRGKKIAVKIIDDRGLESMKILKVI